MDGALCHSFWQSYTARSTLHQTRLFHAACPISSLHLLYHSVYWPLAFSFPFSLWGWGWMFECKCLLLSSAHLLEVMFSIQVSFVRILRVLPLRFFYFP